jgi:hypothetical protein
LLHYWSKSAQNTVQTMTFPRFYFYFHFFSYSNPMAVEKRNVHMEAA